MKTPVNYNNLKPYYFYNSEAEIIIDDDTKTVVVVIDSEDDYLKGHPKKFYFEFSGVTYYELPYQTKRTIRVGLFFVIDEDDQGLVEVYFSENNSLTTRISAKKLEVFSEDVDKY